MDLGGVFGMLAYLLLAISFALSLGVFLYGRILSGTLAGKDAELAKAQAAIDPATVQSFVQLRDRLNSGQTLLAAHTAPSRFFSALESVIPTTVRFSSIHLSVDATGAAKVDGVGISKSFNALSAASTAFAQDGRIKNVIFSKMSINTKDNSVSFGFSASLDPKLILYVPGEAGAVSTTTP